MPHDSDEQWVAFLVEQGALDAVRYDATNRDLIARYNRGEAGSIEFTEFYLSTLTSFDQADSLRWREKYLARKIRPRIRQSARALVERHRAAGDRLLVTTAVFRFLADPIAAEFGIHDVIATEAEQIDGRYTGGSPAYRTSAKANTSGWSRGSPSGASGSPIFANAGSTAIRSTIFRLFTHVTQSGRRQCRSGAGGACATHGLARNARWLTPRPGEPAERAKPNDEARSPRAGAVRSGSHAAHRRLRRSLGRVPDRAGRDRPRDASRQAIGSSANVSPRRGRTAGIHRILSFDADRTHPVDRLEAWREAYLRTKIVPAIPVDFAQAGRTACRRRTPLRDDHCGEPISGRADREEFGFEHVIATEPEMRDGRFTGKVRDCRTCARARSHRLDAWLAVAQSTARRLSAELVLQRLAQRHSAVVEGHPSGCRQPGPDACRARRRQALAGAANRVESAHFLGELP